jgi:hypothetical protein
VARAVAVIVDFFLFKTAFPNLISKTLFQVVFEFIPVCLILYTLSRRVPGHQDEVKGLLPSHNPKLPYSTNGVRHVTTPDGE